MKETNKSKAALITKLYGSHRSHSRTKGRPDPTYSKKELTNWLLAQDMFHELHDAWVNSGRKKMLVPSCDRIDNDKGYSLGNIRVVTWEENCQRGHDDMRAGIVIHGTWPHRPVTQYTLDGEEVATFPSLKEAGRKTNAHFTNINKCCRGVVKSASGYYWKYATV